MQGRSTSHRSHFPASIHKLRKQVPAKHPYLVRRKSWLLHSRLLTLIPAPPSSTRSERSRYRETTQVVGTPSTGRNSPSKSPCAGRPSIPVWPTRHMDRSKPALRFREERLTSTKCSRELQPITGKCAGFRPGQPARNSPAAPPTQPRQRRTSLRFQRNSAS